MKKKPTVTIQEFDDETLITVGNHSYLASELV